MAFIEETLQHRTQEVNNAQHIYDMIVVGGGPGGYTAALYAARAGMDTVVLEKLSAGGQMALTEQSTTIPASRMASTVSPWEKNEARNGAVWCGNQAD